MSENKSQVVDTAREYYNSDDADRFYFTVWGGEDIHIGIYQDDEDTIFDASRRTVAKMAEKFAHYPAGTRLLDIGSGYGGSARYLAKAHGFDVTCLNLSEVQNERNRQMNREQGLADKITVVDGNFEELPFEKDAFELAWSQDAILHSGNRFRVFEEVDRVLRSGGEFVFTDPMQKHGVERERLEPVLARIHLDTMGSPEDYESYGDKLGWEFVGYDRMAECLVNHYSSVKRNLESRYDGLAAEIGKDYLDRMRTGLQHWVDAGNSEALTWGIMHFRKPAK